MPDKFDVIVTIEINKVRPDGGWTGERMTVNERFQFGTAGWVQIADILGRFHGLAETIQQERADVD